MASPSPPRPTETLPRRGFPPPCWSSEETLALIQSYRQKWLSNRRANLRAADWESVAADLSVRSSLLPSATPKTSVQCRHKFEKLRKRFRSERLRSLTLRPHAPPSSSWSFFPIMKSLEIDDHGGLTIPKADRPNPSTGGGEAKGMMTDEISRRIDCERRDERKSKRAIGSVEKMVSSLRMVGDGFMKMERLNMERVRQREMMKMEMQLKRTEMILDSHRRIIDEFVNAFVDGEKKKKKAKVSPDN
ncbi:hypothetical protein KSP40_PGU003692 [Platanthera guangdongensis]|uniref:Myb-like domain-containing protein n=1 Tax=Platanthera guangdongensis TaxID=2320717 RepID=A0ABR2LMV5_9ASPA